MMKPAKKEESTEADIPHSIVTTKDRKRAVCKAVQQALIQGGIFNDPSQPVSDGTTWRISPEPFWLTYDELTLLNQLGVNLLSFYKALNRLYYQSVKGTQPHWIAAYLDQGKPDAVVTYSRMNRFKQHLPAVLRPDLIPTESGMVATELDSVPGGIGITACLSAAYGAQSYPVVGGALGMIEGFARVVLSLTGKEHPIAAIVVSEESKDYRPEMRWLGNALGERGLKTLVVEPNEVHFTEEGLWIDKETGPLSIDLCYRFFELFDLINVPKSELILYSVKKGGVAITPPIKPFLEEKLAFALFHHPVLYPFWVQEMGEEAFCMLKSLFPKTWILDPRELPPYGIIPDLFLGDQPVTHWLELARGTQQERQFVVKPSGFSELAWGSRGVSVGHDLPAKEWEEILKSALSRFEKTPSILQEFHKGKRYEMEYYDAASGEILPMEGRVRLSPYYYVIEDQAVLSGVLSTFCPMDKKLLHGMVDAIMAPCSIRKG